MSLVPLLRCSLDPREEVRIPAEVVLSSDKQLPTSSLAPALLGIVSQGATVEADVRLAAALCLKRRLELEGPGSAAVTDGLRTALLSALLAERTSGPIALQLALAVSRVSRNDLPSRWPDLLDRLHAALFVPETCAAAARALHHVAKSCASRRLPQDVRFMRRVSPDLLELARSEMARHVGSALASSAGVSPEVALLCAKLARTCLVVGVQDISSCEPARAFLSDALAALERLSAARDAVGPQATPAFADALLASLAKTAAKAQSKRRLEFAPYLSAFLRFFFGVVRHPASHSAQLEPLVLTALRFVKSVACNSASQGYRADMWRPLVDGPVPPALVQCDATVREFFSPAVLSEFLEAMVHGHLVLTEEEIRSIAADPESFLEREEEVGAWRYNRRACAETVFLAVADRFPAFARPLVSLLAAAIQAPPSDARVLLAKDAVYAAVGLAAYDLVAEVPLADAIPRWIAELSTISDPSCSVVLRRRVAWLLGNVAIVGLESPPLPVAYQCLTTLLSDSDLSVAFTAAASLHSLVDNVWFNGTEFLPYAPASFSALFSLLLTRTRETSSKNRLLGVVIVVLQQVGEGIAPSALAIAEGLARVWLACRMPAEAVVRTRVLTAFAALVEAVGPGGVAPLYPVVLPLVAHSRASHDAETVLLEDALDLWQALVGTVPQFTDDLLALCSAGRLPDVFSQTSEEGRLLAAAAIARAYFVSGGPSFLALPCANALVAALARAVDGLTGRGIACVLGPCEAMFRLPAAARLPASADALVVKLVSMSQPASAAAPGDPTADKPAAECTGEWLAAVFSVLARAVLRDGGSHVVSLCVQAASGDSARGIGLLCGSVSRCVDSIDMIGSPRAKKLACLAMCDLLPHCFPLIQPILGDVINAVVGAVLALASSDQAQLLETLPGSDGSCLSASARFLMDSDPVVHADLRSQLLARLETARSIHGQSFVSSFDQGALAPIL